MQIDMYKIYEEHTVVLRALLYIKASSNRAKFFITFPTLQIF